MTFKQTHEEMANTLTHLSGAVLVIGLSVPLLVRCPANHWQSTFATLVFAVSALLMYTASSAYHWSLPGRLKRILRYTDHINIYVLIAASYTPVLLCAVGGTLGWAMFAAMWAFVLLGASYKIFFLGKYPRLSLGLYLLMGWSGIMVAVPVWRALPAAALWLLLLEGISYTAGTYFYARDDRHAYYHAIWHVFVVSGTLAHFGVVWTIL